MPFESKHAPLKLDADQREDLLRRAYVAWFRGGGVEVPNEASNVKVRLGKVYVALHGKTGVLAVYRVRQVNEILMLRRMTRWPESVGRGESPGSVGNGAGNEEISI